MGRLGRTSRRALAGLAALLLLGALALAIWEPLAARPGIAPPPRRYDVRIVRDTFGVPHVFGADDPAVAYGLAYAHAEDDFPTLEEVFALTRGRLGALTGADGAKSDYVLALLGVRATVARAYDRQPADVRALLDGYAAGLDRYVATHPSEPRLRRLFPIDGRDVAAGFVLRSPFFFGLDRVLGRLAVGDPPPQEHVPPLAPAPSVTPTGPPEQEKGSNAFAVAPSDTTDGATRLISNAHQPWTGGVAWYELVVHSRTGWDFAGATFPGAPFPLLGHNRTLGWTNTVNRPDLIDVYRLTLDANGGRYRFDGAWRRLERRRVWLRVRFGPFVLPVPRSVARAVQGPVIENRNGAFAIAYAGAGQLRMIEQYYRLTRARTYADWLAAMARQGVPATNFVYADATGRIALFYNAMFPRRPAGYDWLGVLPGDTSRALWRGTLPFAAVPRLVNPRAGFLVNANNTPYRATAAADDLSPAAVDPRLGVETDMTNRAIRAIALLSRAGRLDHAALMRIKFDTGVARTGWYADWFARLVRADVHRDPLLTQAQAILRGWDWTLDGRGRADALACLLMRPANRAHVRRAPPPAPLAELRTAARLLHDHFGRLDPPLGALLRLRSGTLDLPLDGGPDVLRAMPIWDVAGDGRLAVNDGDSFIMDIAWDRTGHVASRSIVPFGAAPARPGARHHADQAPLFAAHRFKPVWFDPAALRGHVERIYRP